MNEIIPERFSDPEIDPFDDTDFDWTPPPLEDSLASIVHDEVLLEDLLSFVYEHEDMGDVVVNLLECAIAGKGADKAVQGLKDIFEGYLDMLERNGDLEDYHV